MLGINLINGVYTARHFGPSGRGTQSALGMWPNLLCFIFTLGVPIALRYHARKHEQEQDALASTALLLSCGLGLVAMVAGMFLLPFIMRQYGPENIRLAQGLMGFVPLGMITLILTSMLEVRFDFTFSNFTRYAPPFVTFAVLVALNAAHALTPFNATLAYLVPPCFTSFAMGIYLYGKFSFRISPGEFGRSTRRLLGFGIRIYGSDVLGTFGQQMDQFLVVGLLAAADLVRGRGAPRCEHFLAEASLHERKPRLWLQTPTPETSSERRALLPGQPPSSSYLLRLMARAQRWSRYLQIRPPRSSPAMTQRPSAKVFQ